MITPPPPAFVESAGLIPGSDPPWDRGVFYLIKALPSASIRLSTGFLENVSTNVVQYPPRKNATVLRMPLKPLPAHSKWRSRKPRP